MLKDNQQLFDIFVAKQEYSGKRDKHGRFLYSFSNYKDILRPIVSEYLVSKGFHVEWPENHKFAACLTHDVDIIYPSWKYTFFTATKFALKLNPKRSLERLVSKARKNNTLNPYWNFRKIIELEREYNAKSSFYFKATSRDLVGWIYDIENLRDELGYTVDLGCEVGLHGGYWLI